MTLLARIAPLFLYVITAECNLNPFYILGLPNKVLSPLGTYTYGEPHQESWPHNIFDPSNYHQDYNTRYESNPYLMSQFGKTNPTAILNVNTNERVPYYNGESVKFPSNVYFPDNHVFNTQEANGLNKNEFQGDWKKAQEIFLRMAETSEAYKPGEMETLVDYDLDKEEISTQHKTDGYKKLSLKTNQDSVEREVLTPIQSIPNPSRNIMLVPLTHSNGHNSETIQVIGNDASNGLPVVNINGLLYYIVNSPNTNVPLTERPAPIIPIDQFNPRNVPSLVLQNGMNSAASGNNVPYVAPNPRRAKIVYDLWPMKVGSNIPQSSGDQRSPVHDISVPKTNVPVPITNVPHLKVNDDELNKESIRNNINDLLLAYILQHVGRQSSDSVNTIKDAQPSVDDNKSLNTDTKSININDLLALINSFKVHDTGKNDAIKNPLLVFINEVPHVPDNKSVALNVNDEKVKIMGSMKDLEIKEEHGITIEGKEHKDDANNKVTPDIVEDNSERQSLSLVD